MDLVDPIYFNNNSECSGWESKQKKFALANMDFKKAENSNRIKAWTERKKSDQFHKRL